MALQSLFCKQVGDVLDVTYEEPYGWKTKSEKNLRLFTSTLNDSHTRNCTPPLESTLANKLIDTTTLTSPCNYIIPPVSE